VTRRPRPGVYTLRHGTRSTQRSDVFLGHRLIGLDDGPIDLDYYLWAVVLDDRIVVVDTGFSGEVAARRGRTVLHDPVELLETTLGISAADVDDLVLTHAHYDHIGNATRFPRATVHIAPDELAFVAGGALDHPLTGHFIEPQEARALADLVEAGRVSLVADDTTIAPGVDLLRAPGHTPGQLMVLVAGRGAAPGILLASDALHFAEELDIDLPFASTMDVPATYATFARIRGLIASGAAGRVVPGHDPRAFEGMTMLHPHAGLIPFAPED
jgi:glyoxylase-like metal-dependent hydrolase (beta-lactamase superfamily II)